MKQAYISALTAQRASLCTMYLLTKNDNILKKAFFSKIGSTLLFY